MELLRRIPNIQYNNITMKNLLVKIATVKENYDRFAIYYAYSIRDGERPDTVAFDYYGSSEYAWLVMLANNITDFYSEWPLDYNDFYSYLKHKYGYIHELKNDISHYEYTGIGGETADEIATKNYKMSITTHGFLSPVERSGWTPVYVYDYEYQLNENKRKIKLLSNEFTGMVDTELKEIFN